MWAHCLKESSFELFIVCLWFWFGLVIVLFMVLALLPLCCLAFIVLAIILAIVLACFHCVVLFFIVLAMVSACFFIVLSIVLAWVSPFEWGPIVSERISL